MFHKVRRNVYFAWIQSQTEGGEIALTIIAWDGGGGGCFRTILEPLLITQKRILEIIRREPSDTYNRGYSKHSPVLH